MTTLPKTAQLMDALAVLLEYPDSSYQEKLQICLDLLHVESKAAFKLLLPFQEFVITHSASDMEEAFTRTFDFNKDSALEIGWHLYGEDYARGDFLVKMRDLLRKGKVAEKLELPDHLTYVLPIVGRMDEKSAVSFSSQYLMPALHKIMGGIEKNDTPYKPVLKTIHFIISENYVDPLQVPGEQRHEF